MGVAACEQAIVRTPTPTTLTLAGATAMEPVLHDLTAEFSRQHPNVLFNWLGGSSATGEERIRTGEVDLAASTLLETKPLSTTSVAKGGQKIVRIPIGLDGLAIIVHPSNPIENVTLLQLHDLFNGHVLDWSMLGSPGGEVILVSREDGSGSRRLFEERVMGDDQVSLTAVVMPTSADVVDYVAQNAGAIGYVSRAYVIDALRAQADKTTQGDATVLSQTVQGGATVRPTARVVRVENQFPTLENLKNQTYFFTQPLFLLSRGQPRGWARQFIDFVLSPAGQTIVERYHARVR